MANIPGTNVPAVTFGTNGFQAPAEQDILTGVMADINAAFGGGLNQSLSSPQGQLATSIAAIIGSCNDAFVNLTNQMNPAFADGRFQDGIAEIYFLSAVHDNADTTAYVFVWNPTSQKLLAYEQADSDNNVPLSEVEDTTDLDAVTVRIFAYGLKR